MQYFNIFVLCSLHNLILKNVCRFCVIFLKIPNRLCVFDFQQSRIPIFFFQISHLLLFKWMNFQRSKQLKILLFLHCIAIQCIFNAISMQRTGLIEDKGEREGIGKIFLFLYSNKLSIERVWFVPSPSKGSHCTKCQINQFRSFSFHKIKKKKLFQINLLTLNT